MRFKRHIELEKGQLDIAPLMDVVFLLLIFFMLTSSFISPHAIKINLPNAVSSKPLLQRDFIIYVTDKDVLIADGKEMNIKELTPKIKAAAKDKRHILIEADKEASLGKVVEIWDLCRDSGITNINIATVPKD